MEKRQDQLSGQDHKEKEAVQEKILSMTKMDKIQIQTLLKMEFHLPTKLIII